MYRCSLTVMCSWLHHVSFTYITTPPSFLLLLSVTLLSQPLENCREGGVNRKCIHSVTSQWNTWRCTAPPPYWRNSRNLSPTAWLQLCTPTPSSLTMGQFAVFQHKYTQTTASWMYLGEGWVGVGLNCRLRFFSFFEQRKLWTLWEEGYGYRGVGVENQE